ncbi:trypsin-like peptidase domain-containing protein [soil metagenome]
MSYDYRPRRFPAWLPLTLALLAIVIVGGIWYAVNGWNFKLNLNRDAVNDPNAAPRPVETGVSLDADETRNFRVFENALESVVNVDTEQLVRNQFTMTVQKQQTGTGSGFIWDEEGRVVTNFHVIRPSLPNGTVRVVLHDHTAYDTTIVGYAPEYDLAVLKIKLPPPKLKPIRLGSSKELKVGMKTYAIGNPFGLDHSLTDGIISALNREINSQGDKPISGVIQTSAAINPGNSGGPLLDKEGRMIGVNTAIASPSGGNVGIGFAIPVDTVNMVVPELIRTGKLLRPDAGLKLVDQMILLRNGIRNGAMVGEVEPAGPADEAGLKGIYRRPDGTIGVGDLITAIDGVKISSNAEYLRAIAKHKVGDVVKFTIEKDGKSRDVDVTLRGV